MRDENRLRAAVLLSGRRHPDAWRCRSGSMTRSACRAGDNEQSAGPVIRRIGRQDAGTPRGNAIGALSFSALRSLLLTARHQDDAGPSRSTIRGMMVSGVTPANPLRAPA